MMRWSNYVAQVGAALAVSALLVGCADEGVEPASDADGVEVNVQAGDDDPAVDREPDSSLDVDVDAEGVNVDVDEDGVSVDVDE